MTRDVARTDANELRLGPLVVFALWTLYGAFVFAQVSFGRPADARPPWKPYGPLVYWLGYYWTIAALTPLIALLVRRVRPSLRRPHTLLAHLAAIALVHALATLVETRTFYLVAREFRDFWTAYPRGLAQTGLLYVTTVLGVLALEQARLARQRAAHAARLQTDLAQARLETLRRQMQPHFLFNTLNTIAELIDTDPARASTMVAGLGDLLRRSLDEHDRPLVPLAAELEFVRLYTDIERVRFEGWLTIVEQIERDTLHAAVPPMILQPLVENAIRHGISPTGRAGTIVLRAVRTDADRLQLEVQDDGVGMATRNGQPDGIGLGSTRERLTHLFGDDAQLIIRAGPERGTRVLLDLPFVLHTS